MTSKFYYGDGSLTERSTLPFDPSAMAVRDNGQVALGNSVSAATMVVTGSTADDYATWTDYTGDYAGGPVKGLGWING
jgi:hypothetical protein